MAAEKAYVLGTHDEEIARLGLQHRAWRPRVLAAWEAAGIGPGQTVLDVGSGPGYCAVDLAEIVGPTGRIVALDKSERFLAALQAQRDERSLANLETHLCDLDAGEFPEVQADAAWCRWALAFVKYPREVLARIAGALRPRGTLVLHEYFDYRTWRSAPRCPELEEFVVAVMASWRATGGEPDIALSILAWLPELGLGLCTARPLVDCVKPGHPRWLWLRAFVEVGRYRLVDLGRLSQRDADALWRAFIALEATPGARMISPGVLEIIASHRT
jgi:SAM-dependent methyltransferase